MVAFAFAGPSRIGGFFAWWFAELASLVPESLRRGFRRRPRVLVLDVTGPEVVAVQRIGARGREIGRIDPSRADLRARRRFAGRVARARSGDGEVVLRLRRDMALQRTLEMPMVADADLRRALFFEIDRQTPFQPDETYYDYVVTARRAEEKRLDVDLTIVPRRVVEDALGAFAEWDVVPTVAEIAADDGTTSARFSLGGGEEENTGRGPWAMFNWLTAFIVLALLVFAFQIPLEARRATEQALKSDVARARARADTTMAMRKELDRLLETDRLLQQRKLEAPSGVAVMEELTRLLPDATWIASLQINQREVRLTGYAPTAASLISLLDGSDQFGTPSFQSPVTQDARSGKERFSLSFVLESDEASQ